MQMVIEFLRRLKEGHVGFVTSKYVEIIEKPDAHVRTTSILNENSIQAIFFVAQSFIVRREIIGNLY